jgi:hypothetical protein
MSAQLSRQRQVQEVIKCGKDPSYFFNTYVKIQHPIKGMIPFSTYQFQDECVNKFIDNRFSIVVKSRQLGLSTLVAAYSVWLAIFQKDKNILVIATKLSVAQNFIKKVKTMVRSLPPWLLLPKITTDNKQLIEFSHGSSIKAVPTSDDAGRSEALSLLIVDEAAFVRDFDTLWTGLYPTISTGGRAILLSTPNGVGGQYYKLYTDAEAGLNEFCPIKLPWDVHPDRDQAWFDSETKNLSQKQISQEYLCDFASSGDTYMSDDDLKWLWANIQTPVEKTGPDRNVWIWKHPIPGHKYIIPADIARGDSKDYSSFHVIDTDSSEVVAEYKGKMPPDRFAELLAKFGEMYNVALLCPENNSYGYATIIRLRDIGYKRIYSAKKSTVIIGDFVPSNESDGAGFATSGKTRTLILTKLEEILRNRHITVRSSRLYDELKTFVWVENRAQAMKGYNDDLVMSLAIGCWLFEASSEYGRDNVAFSEAMLKSMSTSRKLFNGASTDVMTNSHQRNMITKRDPVTRNDPVGKGGGMIPPEFLWVLK